MASDECWGDVGKEYEFGDWAPLCRKRKDMCHCTGGLREISCSETGIRHCGASDECWGDVGKEYEFGDWAPLCRPA